jgi:acetylornithine deacetylase
MSTNANSMNSPDHLAGARPLARQTLARQVADQLVDLITAGDGGLEVVLPPERRLCEQLGVSRNSLREALAALDRLGIIEARGRTRVGLPDRARALRIASVPSVDPDRARAGSARAMSPAPTVVGLSRAEKRVVRAIADGADELVELTRTLVGYDTRTREAGAGPGQEAELQAYLAERLARAGADADVFEPPADVVAGHPMIPVGFTFAGRPHLAARFRGSGGGRTLLLNGHVDTVGVEPRDRWQHDPFAAVVLDGAIHGRGSSDMKGGIASMVYAAETLARLGVRLPGDLVVNTVTDEESTGAGGLVTARTLHADAAIVPEPSGLELWIACRGSLIRRITVTGRAGHAGIAPQHPDTGGAVNAIEKMTILLEAIRRLREEWALRPSHPYLSPADCVPVLIAGGEWIVSYPETCTLDCHIEYLPDQADEHGGGGRIDEEFAAWIRRAADADPWLAAHPPGIEPIIGSVPPAEISADEPIVQAMLGASAALDHRATLGGLDNWHDGATLTVEAGIPALCYGPGIIAEAHTLTEHVRIADLVACAQTLAVTAMRFCSAPS